MLTGCVAGLGDGLGEGLGLGDTPGVGLGETPGLGDGLGLGEVPAFPSTLMLARALLRASSMRKVPSTQNVNENDCPGSRSSLSRKLWSTSRTRARLSPTLVQVTRVPALTVSKLGLNGPPPPVMLTLAIAVASQLGCGLGETPGLGDALGLGDTPGVGDALGLGDTPGVGEALGLGDTPGVGEAVGLGDTPGLGEALGLGEVPGVGTGLGLGDPLGPPTTVMVDLTPLRASSMW